MSVPLDSGIPVPPSPYEGKRLRWTDHLPISAYWFATNFHWGALLIILLPNEMRRLNPALSAPTLGLLTGFGAIAGLLVPLAVSALSDRNTSKWGRRRPYILWGVLINLIGLAMMGYVSANAVPAPGGNSALLSIFASRSLSLSFIAYLVVQFGNNVASAAYMGVIPDVVPPEQRGIASGWMAAMSQGGTLFGAIGAGLLLDKAPPVTKYALIAIVMLIVAPITLVGLKENPLPHGGSKLHWPTYIRSLWIDPKLYPNYAWVWITRFLVMLGFYAVLPFVNYYLADVVGIPRGEVNSKAPLLLGVILIASTITGILGGAISDRVGRRRVVYIANTAIAFIAPLFIFTHSLPLALGVGLLFGLAYGAYISVDYALGTDVLPTKTDAAKEMAVWHVAMTLPQSIAAPIAGWLIALPGKQATGILNDDGQMIYRYFVSGYAMIFILCAVCFALGAYLLKNLRGIR